MTLEAGQARILKRAQMILTAANNRIESHGDRYRDVGYKVADIRLTVGYAEPGYGCTDSIIAFGNWNPSDLTDAEGDRVSGFDLPSDHINALPKKLGKLLEKAGVECEWSDEWAECGDCGKAVRTQGDSYFWTPSYVYSDGEITCGDCVLEDPSSYLEGLEDDENTAITLSVDPEQHGYTQLPESYERGFHPGQDASPALIAEALRKMGLTRFIFRIDAQRQFDTCFSVYVADEELAELARDDHQEHYETCEDADFCAHESPNPDLLEDDADATREGVIAAIRKLAESKTDGPSPSEGLKRALASVPEGRGPAGTIACTKLDVSAGTSKTTHLTPEQFIKGDLP